MTPLDEALALLTKHGIAALPGSHTGAPGLRVMLGRAKTAGEITVFQSCVSLSPAPDGRWALTRVIVQSPVTLTFESLDRAVAAIRELAAAFSPTASCGSCGGIAEIEYGERRASSLTYWITSFCPQCGARSESDGNGRLPDALRNADLVRYGEYYVILTEEPDVRGWRAIRDALDLSLATLSILRQSSKRELLRGTRSECLQLHWQLERAGVATVIGDTEAY